MLNACIDARLVPGRAGGIEQVAIGLADALGSFEPTDERFHFMVRRRYQEWLRPHVGKNSGLLITEDPRRNRLREYVSRSWPKAMRYAESIPPIPGFRPPDPPPSDGTVERTRLDVIHFLCQSGFLTEIPSLYQPHDLQHRHLPELFTKRAIYWRERNYPRLCEQAKIVVAMTEWGRQDLLEAYGLPEDKVRVVPNASVLSVYREPDTKDLTAIGNRFNLPDEFFLYPGQTWPHKNHLALIDAISILRGRSRRVHVICTGATSPFYEVIKRRLDQLGLGDQVRFLGYVQAFELRCLFALAKGLVFPSKFEGWGLPVIEAFEAGIPVASSNSSCLPEVAGDAARFFDPESPQEIADAILELTEDQQLRSGLVARGRTRAGRFSWRSSALLFRALYREAASLPLTGEDLRRVKKSRSHQPLGRVHG